MKSTAAPHNPVKRKYSLNESNWLFLKRNSANCKSFDAHLFNQPIQIKSVWFSFCIFDLNKRTYKESERDSMLFSSHSSNSNELNANSGDCRINSQAKVPFKIKSINWIEFKLDFQMKRNKLSRESKAAPSTNINCLLKLQRSRKVLLSWLATLGIKSNWIWENWLISKGL